MPQELLGAVLRTGDAAGRSRRRWLFPISATAHAIAGAALMIIPLAAEVEPPPPAAPFVNRWVAVEMRQLPAIPPPSNRPLVPSVDAAPTSAPPAILPETDRPPAASGPPGAIDVPAGVPVGIPDNLGELGAAVPPPPPPPAAPPEKTPLHVGGTIRPPRKVVDVPPVYPPMAIAARVEGQVILEALIDERGHVDKVRVLHSVPLLDAAAVDAVRGWRYTPTLLNGVPVQVLMTVTVRFSLQR